MGSEPDPRFSLANERTYLAWVSASIALTAAGVALQAFALHMQPGLRLAASIVLVVAGIAAVTQGWLGWMSVELALRENRPLPSPALAAPIGVAVIVASVLVLLGFLAP